MVCLHTQTEISFHLALTWSSFASLLDILIKDGVMALPGVYLKHKNTNNNNNSEGPTRVTNINLCITYPINREDHIPEGDIYV